MSAGILRAPRRAALVTIAVLVAAASAASFAESYRGLYAWAREHGLSGLWATAWPLQVDVFIAVGELALFVALVDQWGRRSRTGAWTVTLAGLGVSVAGNIGHVTTGTLASRATAAVPPLAAASALAVGLGVLKRVVEHQPAPRDEGPLCSVPADILSAAKASMAATAAAGNPLSRNQLQSRFSLTRAQADEIWAPYAPERGRGGVSIAPAPAAQPEPVAGRAQDAPPPGPSPLGDRAAAAAGNGQRP